jgi:hypothetical protein
MFYNDSDSLVKQAEKATLWEPQQTKPMRIRLAFVLVRRGRAMWRKQDVRL